MGHNSLIVVRADAHTIVLEVESILAEFGMAELVPEKKHREESKKGMEGETRTERQRERQRESVRQDRGMIYTCSLILTYG